jgi:copper transport protein
VRFLRVLVAAVALLWAALPAPVAAHAILVVSDPADGSIISAPPEVMHFGFSEPLIEGSSSIDLIDPDGERIASGIGTIDPTDQLTLIVRLEELPGLAFRPGVWTIVYRTQSTVDGHRWGGSIRVGVADADGIVPGAEEGALTAGSAGPERSLQAIAVEAQARLLTIAGLLIALGLSLVAPLIAVPFRRTSPRIFDLIAIGGIGAAALGSWFVFPAIAIEHPSAGSLGAVALAGIAEAALLRWFGRVEISRIAVAAAAAIGIALWSTATHAAAVSPVAAVAIIVHLGAIAVWAGGLLVFVGTLLLGPRARAVTLALPRLSGLVLFIAPIVALSGVLLSADLLRGPAALFSLYGLLLALKVLVVLIAGVLGLRTLLAARRGRRDEATITRRAGREGAAMLGAALLAGLIATTPIPTNGLVTDLAPVPDAIDGSAVRLPLEMSVAPGRPGPNRFIVRGLPEGATAEILFTRLDDSGDLRLQLSGATGIADVGVLPAQSRWSVAVVVRDSNGTPLDTRGFRLEIGDRRVSAGGAGMSIVSLIGVLLLIAAAVAAFVARRSRGGLDLPASMTARLRGRLDPNTARVGTRLAAIAAGIGGSVAIIAEAILR